MAAVSGTELTWMRQDPRCPPGLVEIDDGGVPYLPNAMTKAIESDHTLVRRLAQQVDQLEQARSDLLRELDQRKRLEKELRVSEERYRAVVETQTELIIRWEPAGTLTFVNHAYSRFVGRPSALLIGTSFLSEIPPDTRAPFKERIARLARWTPSTTDEWEMLLGNGERRWLEWTHTAMYDSVGELAAYQSVGRDVTERREAQEKLRKALDEIKRLKDQMEAENIYLRKELLLTHRHGNIIGKSDGIRSVLVQAEQVAVTDSTVLILGETGTGKELIARAIHDMSHRKEGPFVVVNCAAIPENLVESELFGREKGAYTGAFNRQVGRFEAANGGTIFLDEIGELPEALQAKLLRVLQEGQVDRLGSPSPIPVDVRIIVATNRDLDAELRQGRFREDLFYRLNVFPITVPPLRDRAEDISELAQHFVHFFAKKMGKRIDGISRKDLDALVRYPWPGNVRELRNVIERAMIQAEGPRLQIDLPHRMESRRSEQTSLREVEKHHILAVLRQCAWKIRGADGAAILLDLPPTTLESRMAKLGIRRPR